MFLCVIVHLRVSPHPHPNLIRRPHATTANPFVPTTQGVETFRADKEISTILPKGVSGYEKIGTIVDTNGKTVTIAVTNPVYYPRYPRP